MADPISSLRTQRGGPTLFDQLAVAPQVTQQEQEALLPEESQFVKGTRAGAAGLTAGSLASSALRTELQGGDYAAERDRALAVQQQGARYAPRVSSLRQINGVGDAVDFASGAIGQGVISMAPALAGGAAGAALGRFGGLAGGFAASYEPERGEAALNQYADPEQMRSDVRTRDTAATGKGVINAALESIVPAGLARTALHKPAGSLLGTIGREALTEGATEAAQELVGHEAARYAGSTKELDGWDIADAAAAGALTGGAVSGAARAPRAVADAVAARAPTSPSAAAAVADPGLGITDVGSPTEPVPGGGSGGELGTLGKIAEVGGALNDRFGDDVAAGAEKAKDLAGRAKSTVDDALDRMKEAASTAQNPGEFMQHVFGRDIGDEAAADASDEPNPSLRGATFEETEANISRDDEQRGGRAQRYAETLMSDPATSDDVKAKVAAFGGDYSSPEAQRYVATTLAAQRVGEKFGSAVSSLVEGAKNLGAAVTDRITKKNLQSASPAEAAAFNKVVFDGLTPEAKADPGVRRQLSDVTNALLAFAAKTGDITSKDLPTLTKLQDAMSMFTDPDEMAQNLLDYANLPRDESSFLSRIKSISNAQSDVREPNSFLVSSLTPEAKGQLTAPQIKQLARVVDEFTTQDSVSSKRGTEIVKGLAQAFGDEASARAVLDYYAAQNKADLKYDVNETLQADGTNVMSEKDAPDSAVRFKDAKTKRPFFNGSKDIDSAKKDGTVGQDSEAQVQSYAEYVSQSEPGTGEAAVKRISDDIEGRIEQHRRRTDEDRSDIIRQLQGELSILNSAYVAGGPEAALANYSVLKLAAKEPNELKATDADIAKYGFKNVGQKITFKKTDGKKLALSAESMWKTAGDKEGAGKGEGETQRKQRLLREAIASVLARDDIDALETNIDALVAPPKDSETGAALKAAEGSISEIKAALRKAFKKYEAGDPQVRADIRDGLNTRIAQWEERASSLKGPAAAVAKEKLLTYTRAMERVVEMTAPDPSETQAPEMSAEREADRTPRGAYEEDTGAARPTPENKLRVSAPDNLGPKRRPRDDSFVDSGASMAMKQSAMNAGDKAFGLTADEKAEIRDEVARIRGPGVKVAFTRFAKIGASGEFSMNKNKTQRLIRIAVDSLDPMSVAWHESLHDFVAMLGVTPEERKLKADLFAAAETPQMMYALRHLLRDHPEAIKQIETDREERLAYMYQFWAEGALNLTPKSQNLFMRMAAFFREVLGVLSKDERTQAVFEAFHDGAFADPSLTAAVIQDLRAQTLGDKISAVTGPVSAGAAKVFSSTTDRLRSTNIDALSELADLFHREPGREGGGLPFLQARSQEVGKRLNRLQEILENTTAAERLSALNNLQAMKTSTSSSGLERALRAQLQDFYSYMDAKGVKTFNKDTKSWEPVGYVKDYFPRVWDKNTLRNKETEFKALLAQYIGKDQANKTWSALVNGDGSLELNEDKHSLGFTPFAPQVLDRVFTFIDKSNAEAFAEFQSKDLTSIMTTYAQRAVHRAEYAGTFGNSGEVIVEKMLEAKKQGATVEELATAEKAVMALEGTLGYDFNPRLKEVMGAVQTVQNVILLPMALFSSLIDPLGVAMRSNDFKEAWSAFKYGVKGVADALTKQGDDAQTEMAKTLGLIDEQSMLEAMGHVYNSMYMSPFLKKLNSKFFKANGMELWNQRMRVAAMMTAQRFVIKEIDNQRYMDELGITPKDVHELGDGTLALTEDQLVGAGVPKAEAAEMEKRIQAAVFKFVDGAVLRPNAAHRPIWGSDPRFALLFHLKQFTFSFHQTILARVGNEFRQGNATPALILASYVPFMFLSDVLKGSLTGTLSTTTDLYNIASNSVARSGILGTGVFGSDAIEDMAHGKPPGTSFLGPAFDHLYTVMSGGDILGRSIPFGKVIT